MRYTPSAFALVLGIFSAACGSASDAEPSDGSQEAPELDEQALHTSDPLGPKVNMAGWARSATVSGTYDTSNPFFQSLGTNGRACVTCHQVGEGFTITPAGVQLRFLRTDGTDPLFQPHDTANAPGLDVSTVSARKKAYSLLLERAVVRVGLPVKPDAEFELAEVDDPYGHASATQLSLFRRPLPTTNLRLLGAVNWDGRAIVAADPTNIRLSLKNQSNGATVNHAKAPAPIADDVREAIVDFETSLTTAQEWHWRVGNLRNAGGLGGPDGLLSTPLVGALTPPDPAGEAFRLFAAWADVTRASQADVAEGERIFNTRTLGSFPGTCASCHDATNVGGGSKFQLFDVGVSAPSRRASNVPLYTFRNKATGETIQTTDPGRALISGKWADMNKFKVPGLRGLASRAPYFHDGSARSVAEVVSHYESFFAMGLSGKERRQLVTFLESL